MKRHREIVPRANGGFLLISVGQRKNPRYKRRGLTRWRIFLFFKRRGAVPYRLRGGLRRSQTARTIIDQDAGSVRTSSVTRVSYATVQYNIRSINAVQVPSNCRRRRPLIDPADGLFECLFYVFIITTASFLSDCCCPPARTFDDDRCDYIRGVPHTVVRLCRAEMLA